MGKILLHTCCGPCFLGVYEDIRNKFEITNLFYNPNIQPKGEHKKRFENLEVAAKGKSTEIIELEYIPEEHRRAILGFENEFPSRCLKCYELRLRKTATEAKKLGFDLFSTTLLISPYQQHERLKEIGNKIADESDIEFYYVDWRPYFRQGQDEARNMGLYRQKHCGCNWSEDEAKTKS